MEALCSPRSSESPQNIKTCLNALYTLLDSTWARKVFITNRSLPIELCNVLHRYVYIYESTQLISLSRNININIFVALKIAFNTRKLHYPNDSNGSAETSDESSTGRSYCEKKIETQRCANLQNYF